VKVAQANRSIGKGVDMGSIDVRVTLEAYVIALVVRHDNDNIRLALISLENPFTLGIKADHACQHKDNN
jgi:hypothetical protein